MLWLPPHRRPFMWHGAVYHPLQFSVARTLLYMIRHHRRLEPLVAPLLFNGQSLLGFMNCWLADFKADLENENHDLPQI